jgi:hypothetical protein
MKHLRWVPLNWTTHNWQQRYRCQTNSWQSSVRLSTNSGNISSPLMSRGLIYWQITKSSGCRMLNHPWKGKAYDSSQKSDGHNRIESFRVSRCRRASKGGNIWRDTLYWTCSTTNSWIASGIRSMLSRHSCRQCRTPYGQEVSIILWAKFSENRPYSPYSLDLVPSDFFYSGIWSIVWMEIPILRKKSTFWRNSHIFEGNLKNHFEGHVQGLDEETGLGRRTWRSLLSIK